MQTAVGSYSDNSKLSFATFHTQSGALASSRAMAVLLAVETT